ncbi:MAG: SUF system NifU family Fe-S cluster assembly protein [Longicatena sp.]
MNDYMNDIVMLRNIIMDHYEYPRNHELSKEEGYHQKHMASASCIDDIYVQTKIKDGIVEDIRFDGVACTISTASTSIMSELLQGKSIAEAREIIDNYYAMIDQREYNQESLQEAVAFKNTGKQANRIKCATIGWRAMQELIDESEKTNE